MCKLQDDLWLRQVKINKLDAILNDALNVIWNMICEKNRTSSKKINIDKDKDKDLDGYVSKLNDVIINKYSC